MATERMSDKEVLALLGEDTPLNRMRRAFSSACARIEQASAQRSPVSPVEIRRMEFEAVAEILALASEQGAPEVENNG